MTQVARFTGLLKPTLEGYYENRHRTFSFTHVFNNVSVRGMSTMSSSNFALHSRGPDRGADTIEVLFRWWTPIVTGASRNKTWLKELRYKLETSRRTMS